jgi:hypothetical protein
MPKVCNLPHRHNRAVTTTKPSNTNRHKGTDSNQWLPTIIPTIRQMAGIKSGAVFMYLITNYE